MFVNVNNYGQVINGNIDSTETIRAALSLATPIGDSVVLPPGTLYVSSPITLPSGSHIIGRNTRIESNGNTNGIFLIPQGNSNITLQNITVAVTNCSYALQMSGGVNILLDNCKWYGPIAAGYLIDINPTVSIDSVRIIRNHFENSQHCLRLRGNVTGVDIKRSSFTNWLHYGIFMVANGLIGPKDINIVNNNFYSPRYSIGGAKQPIVTYPDPSYPVLTMSKIHVEGNKIQGTGESWSSSILSRGMADAISINYVDGFNLIGNYVFNGGENGITINNLSSNGIVAENHLFENDGHGIQVGSAPRNNDVGKAYRVLVTNNHCMNNGVQQDGIAKIIAGIYSQEGEDISIIGNMIIDNRNPPKQKYGVLIADGIRLTVRLNDVRFTDFLNGRAKVVNSNSTLAESII